MEVSVIIAVYNAGRFLEKAVTSALEQDEVFEVVLVEDASTDNSLEICTRLAQEYEKVKLIENKTIIHGCGNARNIGLQKAVCEFVAFLDADDYYLPGRFKKAGEILEVNPEVDGVYEAIGTNALDEISLERHLKRVGNSMGKANPMLTTMDFECPSSELFETLIEGKHGFFHVNGLTLRRAVFDKVPFLDQVNPIFAMGADDDFFHRLSAAATLVPGRLTEAVAVRNIYEGNATLTMYTSEDRRKKRAFAIYLQSKNIYRIMLNGKYSKKTNRKIFRQYLEYYNVYYINKSNSWYKKLLKIINLIKSFVKCPYLVFKVI